MMRIHAIVEGQTEETFVNQVLAEYLGSSEISIDVRRVETGRSRSRIYRGGLSKYEKVRKDIALWMKEDKRGDAYFTTMFDLYALPEDFPDYSELKRIYDPYERVVALEEAFGRDIGHLRFIPYIQLHEFEALLLSDPASFDWEFIDHKHQIRNLIEMSRSFESPELINDHPDSAPSKRIIKEIPEYVGRKYSAGPLIAAKIGIDVIRRKCRHFDEWLKKMEMVGRTGDL